MNRCLIWTIELRVNDVSYFYFTYKKIIYCNLISFYQCIFEYSNLHILCISVVELNMSNQKNKIKYLKFMQIFFKNLKTKYNV